VTGDVLHLEEGSLYPALHRMERRGWLEAEWGVSDNNRQVKYYRVTRRGRDYLQRESSGWTEFANAVFKVLQTT
jgi:DNA-binding PadR family transcriptional regulator